MSATPRTIAILAAGALLLSCVPNVTGAPCQSDANCPSGQLCSAARTCQFAKDVPRPDAGGSDGGAPLCDGGTGDVQSDVANCGACGNVCPAPLNSAPACRAGHCGHAACAPGFFDIDGAQTPGCESTCAGTVCTLPDGGTVNLTSPPVPESGLAGGASVNGSSLGANIQSNSAYTNFAAVGEATPAVDGGIEVFNAQYRHRGGFSSTVR
jgi:hypothetical protein